MQLQKAPAVYAELQQDITSVKAAESNRLEELIRYIEARYVDEVDREELIDKAIRNILEELDPHSNYIASDQLRDVNEQLEGNFEGIGIEFMMLDDTIMVVSPISGGPSEAVGIMAGDKIVEIEDSLVAGGHMEAREIIGMLRGKKGSKVKVGVLRANENKVLPFVITRDEIPLNSVDVAYMVDEETGYIKVNRFSATTYREFMEQLERLVEDHDMKDLVIDVRQNPGGYLQEATNILSQLFRDKDKLLVYTEGRSVHRSDYESTGKPFFDIGKVSVLIDEGSASASEIVAAAVQDWDRGTIVGRRSFGKGLVQEQYGLKDGSALRLTVARYYTPSGRLIQKAYDKDNPDQYDEDVYQRLESGELMNEDNIKVADTTKYYTASGRTVYGGGGITPDLFIPIDTILLNDYYIGLRQHVPQFVYRYINDNVKVLEQSLSSFKRNFEVSDQLFREFIRYSEEKGMEAQPEEFATCEPAIKRLLKARVARHLFGDEGFYSIWNEEDAAVQEALKSMEELNPMTAQSGQQKQDNNQNQ
ncbi:MAG: S41 family peptidase [Bacteroidota bacterium]